jgi:superfamily II DNA/RNA helicase
LKILNTNLTKEERPRKAVVFSSFLKNGIIAIEKAVNERYPTWRTASIHGGVSDKKRESIRKQFNKGDLDILFIGEAGATSLDLEGVVTLIAMEPLWNGKDFLQVLGRGRRYRQNIPDDEKTIDVYLLILDRPKGQDQSVDRLIYENMMKAKEAKLLVLDWVMEYFSIEHDPTFRNTVKSAVDGTAVLPSSL